MRPENLQIIGDEVAVRWDDGQETYIPLVQLRRRCPCAGCAGEKDILGNVYKAPDRPLGPEAFRLVRIEWVGGYALQPTWGDGHSTGIYTFEYLKRVAAAPEAGK